METIYKGHTLKHDEWAAQGREWSCDALKVYAPQLRTLKEKIDKKISGERKLDRVPVLIKPRFDNGEVPFEAVLTSMDEDGDYWATSKFPDRCGHTRGKYSPKQIIMATPEELAKVERMKKLIEKEQEIFQERKNISANFPTATAEEISKYRSKKDE